MYSLHGQELEQVKESKYLGLMHQQTLGFLRRNLRIGSIRTKNLAYKALVRPILEYASSVWDPHQQKEVDEIEKVQRRAAQFVQNRHRNTSSVGEMLDRLQWPTLQQRRRDARITMLSKILDKKVEVK